MTCIVPTFIFVPSYGVEKECCSSQEELSHDFYCFSRWTEGKPSAGLSPPKQPPRREESCDTTKIRASAIAIAMPSSPFCKTDSRPKLPQRSSVATTPATSSSDNRRHRRVRSLPVSQSRLPLSEQLRHQRQVLTRNIPLEQPQVTASRIVERAHQKTRRPGPRKNTIMARAA